ncbi:MAG: response regulator, partial [Chloroflexota bacterium]|nr:response regulator [Chloroflexota bacterium]
MTRIAVVNNDTVFLEMMAAVLAEHGWDTAIYKEADSAFETLKACPPDLIILDIRMERPESGWTLLELLTLDPKLSKIPTIVCSAAIIDLRTHASWLERHGIAILIKPFDIADLYLQVETALQSRPLQ